MMDICLQNNLIFYVWKNDRINFIFFIIFEKNFKIKVFTLS